MAINKSNSPVWVKVTLIVLIVAFVLSFITIVANPFAPSQPQTQPGTATNGAAQGVDAQYQPQVDSLTTQLQADPKNYAALVSLGNAYFDWAIAKEQASQGTTTSAAALAPLWLAAKDAYSRALEVKGDESPVRTDYAITVFYSGDTVAAIKIAEDVTKADPDVQPRILQPGHLLQRHQRGGQGDRGVPDVPQARSQGIEGRQPRLRQAAHRRASEGRLVAGRHGFCTRYDHAVARDLSSEMPTRAPAGALVLCVFP